MNPLHIKNMLRQYEGTSTNQPTKIREILQQTALLGLERHGFFEKAAFYGGTALRILYGLDRFSEDLDFTLLKPTPDFNFAPFLEGLKQELASFGFEMDVAQKQKSRETSIVSAFMKMNTILLYLAIGDEKQSKTTNHNEKVQIKLEVDIDPPGHFRVENHIVLNPISFPILTLAKSDLFAGKMHAMLYRAWKGRVKGRDWYDFIWYLQNKIPVSIQYLESCMKQAGNLAAHEALDQNHIRQLLRDRIQKLDWTSAKEDVRPFIADPRVLEHWSASFFLDLIPRLTYEI